MNDSEININKKFTPETILKKKRLFLFRSDSLLTRLSLLSICVFELDYV